MSDLRLLGQVHLFPVRHHSPRASAVLSAFLEEVQPKVVLVEGPEDATSLIGVLVDAETVPPVAVLGYRTDGVPGSSLWPFAAYSPEYVALKWARENGKEALFIDIPIGTALGAHVALDEAPELDEHVDPEIAEIAEEETVEAGPGPTLAPETEFDVHAACAEARGFRSFEEFWEASFEAPSYDVKSFREALIAYADLVRAVDRRHLHRARDAHMTRRILERLARGDVAPEQIAVVVGAAHAAAFAAGDVDLALAGELPEPVPCAATLIPFSYPRLAEQLGYGAGNRAPQYYQRAHDAGCSYRRATLEVLVEFTEHLRLRGFMASLADTIEAYRLAVTLADVRGKSEPGLDEVREATIATMCRGDATHVDAFLWPSVIGRNIGKVADRIGKNSLQEEFWREVRERRLPATDSVESFVLKLNEPVQVATSVFLHRLGVAGVPYASYIGKNAARPRSGWKAAAIEETDEKDALQRTREAWEAQWTPSTDAELVQKIVLGDSLEQVATRVLEERLAAASGAGQSANVLLQSVIADCARVVASALVACDRFAADDDDLVSLAKAAGIFSMLASYGSSRSKSAHGDKVFIPLCKKAFERAVLRAPQASACADEAMKGTIEADGVERGVGWALRELSQLALSQPIVDRELWFNVAGEISGSYTVNPSAAGLATGLLYQAQRLADDDMTLILGQRLSSSLDPIGAAGFLEGFLKVNTLILKNRMVVAALDFFLTGIEPERFRDVLPVLRRVFSPLQATERRYLLENVIGVRSIGDKASEAQAILLEKDKEKLKEMSADLSKAMDDLDDLL